MLYKFKNFLENKETFKNIDGIVRRDVAILARKLGFTGKTYGFYNINDSDKSYYEPKNFSKAPLENWNDKIHHNRVSAPEQVQLRMWLISEFDIHVRGDEKCIKTYDWVLNKNMFEVLTKKLNDK